MNDWLYPRYPHCFEQVRRAYHVGLEGMDRRIEAREHVALSREVKYDVRLDAREVSHESAQIAQISLYRAHSIVNSGDVLSRAPPPAQPVYLVSFSEVEYVPAQVAPDESRHARNQNPHASISLAKQQGRFVKG